MFTNRVGLLSRRAISGVYRNTNKESLVRANPNIRECEALRQNPVSGLVTWYDVETGNTPNGRQMYAKKLYIQSVKSGDVTTMTS